MYLRSRARVRERADGLRLLHLLVVLGVQGLICSNFDARAVAVVWQRDPRTELAQDPQRLCVDECDTISRSALRNHKQVQIALNLRQTCVAQRAGVVQGRHIHLTFYRRSCHVSCVRNFRA